MSAESAGLLLPVEDRGAVAAPADPASAASADGTRCPDPDPSPLSAHVWGTHHFRRKCHVELLLRQVAVVSVHVLHERAFHAQGGAVGEENLMNDCLVRVR